MTAMAERLKEYRALLVLAALAALTIFALADHAHILGEITGDTNSDSDDGSMGDLMDTAERASDWMVTISLIIAPFALFGCAVAMQVGGKRMGGPVMASIGGVGIAVLAKAMTW